MPRTKPSVGSHFCGMRYFCDTLQQYQVYLLEAQRQGIPQASLHDSEARREVWGWEKGFRSYESGCLVPDAQRSSECICSKEHLPRSMLRPLPKQLLLEAKARVRIQELLVFLESRYVPLETMSCSHARLTPFVNARGSGTFCGEHIHGSLMQAILDAT